MLFENVPFTKEQFKSFCRKHHIRKLSLFGSVLREDFRDDSDIDVLVVHHLDNRTRSRKSKLKRRFKP